MYSPTVRQTSSIASGASCREVSTPRPSRVTVEWRSSCETRPSATSATRSRVEFVPMSTTATRIARNPTVLGWVIRRHRGVGSKPTEDAAARTCQLRGLPEGDPGACYGLPLGEAAGNDEGAAERTDADRRTCGDGRDRVTGPVDPRGAQSVYRRGS